MEKTDWEMAVDFHGHSCPGLAIGYRVAKAGLREIAGKRDKDEELVAIVENDACGVDAIQFLTGCTLGKGNLIFRDFGKHVYTLACRNSGKAVRISVSGDWRRDEDERARAIRERVAKGTATEEETELFRKAREERIHHILEAPEESVCTIRHTKVQLPEKARIFTSVTCGFCNEEVSESRARLREGKIACIPCAGEYTRGW
jgi:formylmethanofuran dehydrogenase subunit E